MAAAGLPCRMFSSESVSLAGIKLVSSSRERFRLEMALAVFPLSK